MKGYGTGEVSWHAGSPSHDESVDNLTLFAEEVFPRLKEYRQASIEIVRRPDAAAGSALGADFPSN